LAIALVAAAAVHVADRPGSGSSPAAAPTPRLVPGGLLRSVVIMDWPTPIAGPTILDRIADAVEGAESSYGRDPLMWRADRRGPQGPMQVSEAAAIDVGGGNRFDLAENRGLGRAYLARMYQRYGNWRDALLAYNWGPGNLDLWINAGRPFDRLSGGISSYVNRVLYESAAQDDLLPAGPNPGGDEIGAPERPRAPPHPEIRAETILDPGLRAKIVDNNRISARLEAFLDAAAPAPPDATAYAEPTLAWLKSADIDPEKLAVADPEALRLLRQAAAELVLGIARQVAKHPGYENFRMTKARSPMPDIGTTGLIASVLLAKIEEENAALALVDAHKSAGRPRTGAAAAAPARSAHG
jgi:hypothetical protein